MKPLVSIVIPCYNYGRYLAAAIESAMAQTYSPIEIIVINDGSTDDTVEVASKYPVMLINQKNSGASNTFNRGIELAKGKYTTILSADDKLHPRFVEKTVTILEQSHDVAFVYTHAYMFGVKKGKILSRPYSIDTLKVSNYIFGTALVRSEAYRQSGEFDTNLLCLEDYDLWLTFAENGLFGSLLPEPLFYYRQQYQSRNVYTTWLYRRTMMHIWKKHKGLYSQFEIGRIVILGRLKIITVIALGLIEKILPKKLAAKINVIKKQIRDYHGCIYVEE
ncbi:MAG TPA: glycosyltransferase [Nitrospirota bacterium]|nr:glycosyltransferase [Nitrospirota bacterium]